MFAIRSGWPGWPCSAEFSQIEAASIDPEFARIGIVQPTRHAKAASQRESPAATTVLKA